MAVAGTVAVAAADIGGGYTCYTIAWVASAGGAVSENPVTIKRGRFHQVEFVPDAGGTQPTDAYDLTLLNAISGGFDFLLGVGADLSNANRKVVAPVAAASGVGSGAGPIFHRGGDLYPTIANAGNAKGGTIILTVGP